MTYLVMLVRIVEAGCLDFSEDSPDSRANVLISRTRQVDHASHLQVLSSNLKEDRDLAFVRRNGDWSDTVHDVGPIPWVFHSCF